MATAPLPYKTAEKALLVLQAFTVDRPLLGVTELARRFEMNPGAMSRLLRAIGRRGFVQRDPATGKYRLGWEILRLARVMLEAADLHHVCSPLLHRLEERWHETATLCVREGREVINLNQVRSRNDLGVHGAVGRRTSVHSTGAGKALIAWLPEEELRRLLPAKLPAVTPRTIADWPRLLSELAEVRQRGFAIAQEENDIGVNVVAAPIRDHTGTVVAALAVSAPAFRLPLDKLVQIATDVQRAANEASRGLGCTLTPREMTASMS